MKTSLFASDVFVSLSLHKFNAKILEYLQQNTDNLTMGSRAERDKHDYISINNESEYKFGTMTGNVSENANSIIKNGTDNSFETGFHR